MLSISEELSNFSSIDLESVEQKIGKIPDDMKYAIELYNKALEDIQNKNEDIAIIALKKAVSVYPAFYEAMNLMGVCYLNLGEEENARGMFNRVIQMDDNSIRAMHYLEQMDGSDSPDKDKSKLPKAKNNRKTKNPAKAIAWMNWISSGLSPERDPPYFFKYIVGFVLGVLCICLLWLFLPNQSPVVLRLGRSVNESQQMEKLKAENLDLNRQLDGLMTDLETARKTENQLRNEMDQYGKWSAILRNLQNLAEAGKYMDVVKEIEKDLSGLDLPEPIETEIIALNNECKPKAVSQLYSSAKKIYASNANARDPEVYKQSADEYKMVIRIIEELGLTPSNMAEIYYYGGKAIALSKSPSEQDAEEEAIRCFDTVISSEPGSKLASYAQARINELESGKEIKH